MADPIKDLGVEANLNRLLDEVKSMSNRMEGMSLEKKNLEAERDAALSREKTAEKRVAELEKLKYSLYYKMTEIRSEAAKWI
ncbi:hypothetical protein V6N13_103113 [Hibiscus sabdariffa]|uniref:Uncharacterized protein n=1 Tax=Hibiscus sabdariffa TaxID=183260 RepID=A0ABR2C5N8_9ROSI